MNCTELPSKVTSARKVVILVTLMREFHRFASVHLPLLHLNNNRNLLNHICKDFPSLLSEVIPAEMIDVSKNSLHIGAEKLDSYFVKH